MKNKKYVKIIFLVNICLLIIISLVNTQGCNNEDSTILDPPQSSTGYVVGIEPVEISFQDFVKIKFPANSFNKSTNINIEKTNSSESNDIFNELSGIFGAKNKINYEVKIIAEDKQPLTDSIEIKVNLPPDYISSIPSDHGIYMMCQLMHGDDDELIDDFEPVKTKLDLIEKTIISKIPIYAFSSERRSDNKCEAIITIAAIPGTNIQNMNSYIDNSVGCQGSTLKCPIGTGCEASNIADTFGVRTHHPTTGKRKLHTGIDFRAPIGTNVYAAAKGKVLRVNWNKKNGTGYGWYMDIEHEDHSVTRYAHLNGTEGPNGTPDVFYQVNQPVNKGDVIALSGQTGGVTGPHLHFEYAPNGQIFNDIGRVDPFPCIGDSVRGSITVRDNGNIADDAFNVFLENVLIGYTQIGGSNTLGIGNLRPGLKTLRIHCYIAPDDVGTYEVLLNDGLTFQPDGSTEKSGILQQNESVSFSIQVPSSFNFQSKISVRRKNEFIER